MTSAIHERMFEDFKKELRTRGQRILELEAKLERMSATIDSLQHVLSTLEEEQTDIRFVLGPTWITQGGFRVTPKFMSNNHLQNMLEWPRMSHDVREAIHTEIERRASDVRFGGDLGEPLPPVPRPWWAFWRRQKN